MAKLATMSVGMEDFQPTKEPPQCRVCSLAKAKRLPYRGGEHPQEPGDLIYTDLVPVTPRSWSGFNWWMSVIDGASRMTFCSFMRNKSEAAHLLFGHIQAFHTQYGVIVKRVRADGETVLGSTRATDSFIERGIKFEPTTSYSPEQNGLAEIRQYQVHIKATTMLKDSGLPAFLWPEATAHAVHLINMAPTKSRSVTPYELWHGKKPDLRDLRIFGAVAFYPKAKRIQSEKFTPKGAEGRFVGNDGTQICKIYVPAQRKVVREHNAVIREDFDPPENSADYRLEAGLQFGSATDLAEPISNRADEPLARTPGRRISHEGDVDQTTEAVREGEEEQLYGNQDVAAGGELPDGSHMATRRIRDSPSRSSQSGCRILDVSSRNNDSTQQSNESNYSDPDHTNRPRRDSSASELSEIIIGSKQEREATDQAVEASRND